MSVGAMFDKVKQLLAVPSFADEEKARLAHLLSYILVLFLLVSVLVFIWQGTLLFGAPLTFYEILHLSIIGLIAVVSFISIFLVRRGHITSASALLSLVIWFATTLWGARSSGIRDVSVTGYFLVVFISGLVLGGRTTIAFALLCVASMSLSFYLQTSGHLNVVAEAGLFDFVVLVASLTITVLLLRFSTRIVEDAFQRARRNEQALAEINRMLEEEIVERRQTELALQEAYDAIEERVQERTIELHQEIAERQKVQEALWESEKRFRAIAETANDGIIIFDKDERIFFWNEAAKRLFGYSPSDTQGKLIGTILVERFSETLRAAVDQILADDDSDLLGKTLGGIGRRKDGTEFPIELSLSTWKAQGIVFFTIIVRDVTIRKETEQALRQAYEEIEKRVEERTEALEVEIAERKRVEKALRIETLYLERLFEGSPEAIVLVDNHGRVLRVNSEFIDLFGYTFDEIQGSVIDRLIVPGDLYQEAFKITRQVLGGRKVTFETVRRRRDGSLIDVSILGTPIKVDDGQIAVYGIYRDISERKRAEIERERLLADLQHRSRQLQTAAEVSRAVSSILNPDDLICQVVDLVRERFDLYYVGLFLVDQSGEWTGEPDRWAVLRAGAGEAGQELLSRAHRLEIDDRSMVGQCIITLQACVALDVSDETLCFRNPVLPETRSSLALPLISRGEVIGALSIQSDRSEAFSEEDIVVFRVMADQTANAIQNAYLFEDVRVRSARLTVLNYIARAVSAATLQLDELLNVVYQEISIVFEADAFCIAFYDETTDELEFRLLIDEGLVEPSYREPLGNGFISHVVSERKPLLVQNFEREAENLPTPHLFGTMKSPPSWLGVPMFLGDQVIGAICVQAYRPYAWGEEEQLLLATISDEVAAAVRNARLFEQAQQEIQERKRAEEALRLTQFSLDRAADAIFWMGPDTRFVYANDAACRSLGYSRDEMHTMCLHDIDPNYPSEVWPAYWQAIKQKG
ncbi:MAG TPA: PAS domain S-box protein, partial [Chloroflexi bacterium]|nr:PAS domain S-box protein [Chloroflexota bacterium]